MALNLNDYDYYYLGFLGFSTLITLSFIVCDIIPIKDIDIMNETIYY